MKYNPILEDMKKRLTMTAQYRVLTPESEAVLSLFETIADQKKVIKDLVTALERIEAQERDLLIISGDTKEGVSLHIASKALEAARKAGK